MRPIFANWNAWQSWQQWSEEEHFLAELWSKLIAADRPTWQQHRWDGYHRKLYQLSRELAPNKIVEIGVRAGYSGLTFLRALPECHVTGYDARSEPDSDAHREHATRLLEGLNYEMLEQDSHQLENLPPCDLVYVDGDHSYHGCLNDLRLAWRHCNTILVDDYGSNQQVQQACDWFCASNSTEVCPQVIPYNPSGGAFCLIRRRPKSAACGKQVLSIAMPAGIGDTLWIMAKLESFLRYHGAEYADIAFCDCGDTGMRAADVISRFPFVKSVRPTQWSCVESDAYLPSGGINYGACGSNWHHEFDWLLQVNGHLEAGKRLETWLPECQTDWHVMDQFWWTGGELRMARDLRRKIGPYAVFYCGPIGGNANAGHNRGSVWKPEDWCRMAHFADRNGILPVLVGAAWDRPYGDLVSNALREAGPPNFINLIGATTGAEVLSLIRHAEWCLSYQSGLGVAAVYMGVRTAMWWRPYGDSIDPDHFVSFHNDMSHAWAPPDAVSSGLYKPCLYGQETADEIAEFFS